MIATISRQGGRRYPQMRAAWSAHIPLPFGSVAGVIIVALVGVWQDVEYIYADRGSAMLNSDRQSQVLHTHRQQVEVEANRIIIGIHADRGSEVRE